MFDFEVVVVVVVVDGTVGFMKGRQGFEYSLRRDPRTDRSELVRDINFLNSATKRFRSVNPYLTRDCFKKCLRFKFFKS